MNRLINIWSKSFLDNVFLKLVKKRDMTKILRWRELLYFFFWIMIIMHVELSRLYQKLNIPLVIGETQKQNFPSINFSIN